MRASDFCHLHLHTDHSFLDGVGRAEEYAHLASKHGQRAIAVTDHGGLHGLPAMRRACKDHGLKLIPGCEFYVNDDRDNTADKKKEARQNQRGLDPEFGDHHLVVLAVEQQGWKSLLKINHDSVRNGFYYKPRTTNDVVIENNAGLVVTTACLGSEFAKLGIAGKTTQLRALLSKYLDVFCDRFYAEIHVNECPEQKAWNGVLIDEASRMGIPMLLACDVHYACSCDTARQDEMVGIARHKRLSDPDYWSLSSRHLWFQTPSDLWDASIRWGMGLPKDVFRRAAMNTVAISERASCSIYDDSTLKPPKFRDQSGSAVGDPFRYLRDCAVNGLVKLMKGSVPSEYKDRLVRELVVIKNLGMSEFYLVTMDVVNECRSRGIFVWTRGSGCGSLVAAAIGITRVDPIRFGLLFERFVDPSRPNAPDFDLDIDSTRRTEIVDWLTRKYGGENGDHIARIVSLNTFKIKSAIQDVCWCHGHDRSSLYRISDLADMIDPSHEKAIASSNADDIQGLVEKAFNELVVAAKNNRTQKEVGWLESNKPLVCSALSMAGRVRGKGLHAAGYVVSPGPLEEYLPIDRGKDPETGEPIVITAWGEGQASQDIAETGLLKLDLLSLDTISVVSSCFSVIKERHGVDLSESLDVWDMDWSDPKVMHEFHTGNGFGLHQLNTDSQHLASFIGRLKPSDVRGVIAAVAMYRPGPMQFCDTFIVRSRGKDSPESVHPVFDSITAETFGIMVYQEQVMSVLNQLGGVPLRDAYSTIKAISKKKLKDIQKSKEQFLGYAQANHGLTQSEAARIFGLIEQFAGYGFNKAHSASYGILSFITAYLRAYYPTEFWLCWLNRTENKSAKRKGIQGARKLQLMMQQASLSGQKLIAPIVGVSLGSSWRILKNNSLVAPLSIAKGLGEAAGDAICHECCNKKINSIWKFLAWAENSKGIVNTRALRALAQVGAFRSFKVDTNTAVSVIDSYASAKVSKSKGSKTEQTKAAYKAGLEFDTDEGFRMRAEFEVLGFNFWSNPWTLYGRENIVSRLIEERPGTYTIGERGSRDMFRPFCVTKIRRHKDKRGGNMAFISLLGVDGKSVDGICFSGTWSAVEKIVMVDRCYMIRGDFDNGGKYIVGAQKGRYTFVDIDQLGQRIGGV